MVLLPDLRLNSLRIWRAKILHYQNAIKRDGSPVSKSPDPSENGLMRWPLVPVLDQGKGVGCGELLVVRVIDLYSIID